MYKLEIKLKQHTPLIHFQHDQEGATLRASEVKPKLDQFIIQNGQTLLEEMFNDDELYETDKKYNSFVNQVLFSEQKTSFQYKLSIKNDSDRIDRFIVTSLISRSQAEEYKKNGYKVLSKTPYFADNKVIKDARTGDKSIDDAKLGIMLQEGNTVNLTFRFFDPFWKLFLERILPVFFAATNFGTRQNKGFGCFYPINKTQQDFEYNLFEAFFPVVYCSSIPEPDLNRVFSKIDSLYKKLKSGERGSDSELRKYFNNKSPIIEWEKPAIQKKISEISYQRIRIDSRTDNIQFVRAILGLPELYEYPRQNMKVKIKYENEDIQRYPSPILFKVFDNYIYILPVVTNSLLADKSFKFEFVDNRGTHGNRLMLKIPQEFDISDFLKVSMSLQRQWIKI